MRTAWCGDGRSWTLRLRLDPDESLAGTGQGRQPIQLLTNCCTVTLPDSVDEPHPDLLAAAGLLIVWPWVRQRLTVDRPISAALADAVAVAFSIEAGPVDDALPARRPGERVGLSYSSGVDSVALAEILDGSAPYIHLERVTHPRVPNRATHIRSNQLARLARRAGERGRRVVVAGSDLEYLCLPWPQYPTWPAVAAAAVMLADHLDLGALGFGSVLESVYLGGGRAFRGAGTGPWGGVLSAAGLPLCRPSAGLTEVGTLRLAQRSDLADLAQSCLLGGAGRPCLSCAKCVRKALLSAAVERREVDPAVIARLGPGDPAAKDFEGPAPLHMQNIAEYVVTRVPGLSGTVLGDLARRMDASEESTSWNERFYPLALDDQVPPQWRTAIAARLRRLVDWMDADDVRIVESFDGRRRLRSEGHEGGPAGR